MVLSPHVTPAAAVVVTAFGLIAGSFLALCAYRLPRGLSVVHPGSRCPACGHRLGVGENIPLLSWMALGGRCRQCHIAISTRYAWIEGATAAAFLACWWRQGGGGAFIRCAFFLACLVLLTATDLEWRELPDEVTLGGWAVGWATVAWSSSGWLGAIIAGGGGAAALWLARAGYQRWRGRPGLGWGDIKMMGMLGAFLGPRGLALTLAVASMTGALAGVAMAGGVGIGRLRRGRGWRRSRASVGVYLTHAGLPFGVFLAAGAAVTVFCGPQLWRLWLG